MSGTRFTLGFDRHNMVPSAAATSEIYVVTNTEDGIAEFYATGAPPTTANKYAEGCIYHKHNASSNDTLYVNNGTYASPSFEKVLSSGNVIDEIENDHLASSADDSGPSPLIWDGAPVLEVMLNPGKGFHVWEDFLTPDVYATGVLNGGLLFTQQNGAGTVAADLTLAGGILTLDTGTAAADDGPSVQFPGMQVLPAPGTTIYLEYRLKIDMDDGDVFIGIADSAGATGHLGVGTIATDKDMACFFRDDGTVDAKMGHQVGDGSNVDTADDTIADVDKAAYENYGIVITGDGATAGDNVKFYHKGVLVKTNSTLNTIPDKVLCPLLTIQAHAAAQDLMTVDWMRMLVYNGTAGTVRI